MKKLISCEFNMDTACVVMKFTDGTLLEIDCIAVENEVADNLYQISALDYLIYNHPLKYAELILNDDVREYLQENTDYRPLDER